MRYNVPKNPKQTGINAKLSSLLISEIRDLCTKEREVENESRDLAIEEATDLQLTRSRNREKLLDQNTGRTPTTETNTP
jgi:hypothetical protein